MKYLALILTLALIFGWAGTTGAGSAKDMAKCTVYRQESGSGTETDTYYCPDRFLPGHRTDHNVTVVDTPRTPYQRHVRREYQPPYYRIPISYKSPCRSYNYYGWPVYYYSYSTYNPGIPWYPGEPIYWIQNDQIAF